jgi:glycosyltransferase involved in cell wall biosynthesis
VRHVCALSSVHRALDNRVFYREARSLKKAGYEVTVIAVHDRDEVKDGVEILGLPQVPRWRRPFLWWRLLLRALSVKADIYHFHDPELLLVTPWLRWITGKPTVYDVHEVYADFIKVKDYMPPWLRYPIAWIFRWLEPALARLQSGLIFSDEQIARTFKGLPLPQVTLFNYPSQALIERGERSTRTGQETGAVILHLGGHERNRGTGLMVSAFDQVLDSIPDARLLLVGHFMPPDLEMEVRADLARRGIDSGATITGRVPFETIGEYLAQARVGWVPWGPAPKNQQNIPTKLFEYMAYGLPVVCSDLESVRPFVKDGLNGYRVPADDPSAHARAITAILRDPEGARQMGARGQSLVREEFNWGKMEARLWRFYARMLNAPDPDP